MTGRKVCGVHAVEIDTLLTVVWSGREQLVPDREQTSLWLAGSTGIKRTMPKAVLV